MLMNYKKMGARGFTLIETILTLVMVAILGTMLFTYFGSKTFTSSANPIQWVKYAQSVHQVMEMITADYQGYPRWKPGTSYTTAGSPVTPVSRNGYFYKNSGSCISGATEPAWTLPSSTTPWTAIVTDNTCTWTAVHFNSTTPANRTFIMSLATLRQKIAGNVANISGEGNTVYYNGDPSAGIQYTIVDNHYINPPTDWDADYGSATSYLKLTVQEVNGNGKLTTIFTE